MNNYFSNFKYINYDAALKNYDIELLKRKYETKVIFRVKKKLVHLFKKNEFEVISETDPLPQHDYHCLLLSLPKIFFEKEKKLAKRINYINVDEKIILKWKDKLYEKLDEKAKKLVCLTTDQKHQHMEETWLELEHFGEPQA